MYICSCYDNFLFYIIYELGFDRADWVAGGLVLGESGTC